MKKLKRKQAGWSDIFALFLADRAVSCRPRTLRYYRLQWATWEKFSQGAEPSRELCQAFFLHLARTCNANGVLAVWRGVRTVFNFARAEGLHSFDPSTVKAPKLPKTQKEPLTDAECRKVLAACANPRDKAIVALLLDTGLRNGELCGLRVSEVNWESREVFVRDGKGGKQRTIPFSHATLRILRKWEHYRETASPWFFHNVDINYGTQLTTDYLTRCIARIGQRAGVLPLGPHRLRHTFGRLFIAAGGDTAYLQRLMGHASVTVTMQYVKLNREDLQRGHAKHSPLARVMFGAECR